MKTKFRILITGACGVTSRSVVRSLSVSERFKDSEFIGTDICDNIYGIYEKLYKRVYKVPHVNAQDYRPIMEQIIRQEVIDAVVVVPELEVLYWSSNPFSIPHIVPPPKFSESVISKRNLYNILSGSGLIPGYSVFTRSEIQSSEFASPFGYPCWVRDFAKGSTSGKGAYMASSKEQLNAWMVINEGIEYFMLSEFLPGRNHACHLLFYEGEALKVGTYERLEYFMKKVAVSGISGNISRGRLVNDDMVKSNAMKAIEIICKKNKESMHGLVAVDTKGDSRGNPLVTEINIRHVACTSAFASAGFNLAEYQMLCALDRTDQIDGEQEKTYPKDNLILRDIDGPPVWISEYAQLEVGESR